MSQYIKMAEAIVEPIVDVVVEKEEPPAPIVEPAAPEKKRGRPSGAKDRAPRKKKVTIVEEPLEAPPPPPEPETPKPRTKPAPKAIPKSDVAVETHCANRGSTQPPQCHEISRKIHFAVERVDGASEEGAFGTDLH